MWDYNRLNKRNQAICERDGIDEKHREDFKDVGNDSPLFRYGISSPMCSQAYNVYYLFQLYPLMELCVRYEINVCTFALRFEWNGSILRLSVSLP